MLTDIEIHELIKDLADFAEVNDSFLVKQSAKVMAALHYHYLLEKQEADEQSKIVVDLNNKYNDLKEKVIDIKSAVSMCVATNNSTGSTLLLTEALDKLKDVHDAD